MTKQKKNKKRAIIVEKVITPNDVKKIVLIGVLFIATIFIFMYFKQQAKGQQIPITTAIQEIEDDKVSKIKISDTEVTIQTKNKQNQYTNIESQSSFLELLQREGIKLSDLKTNGIDVDVKSGNVKALEVVNVIINVAFLAFLGYSIYRFINNFEKQSGGGGLLSFGKSNARVVIGKKPEVTFKDVAGLKEVKQEIEEVVEFLREPKKFLSKGARIPKGILLEGPPGTGKTLLARAVAGEAGVPFFHTSGAEFEEMLVGAGAARVRDLFKRAKNISPAIIFIDEIDAVAKKRGVDFRSTYSEQTLNQILVEMDGFEKTDTVIVIGATNRADVLDPALLRPGRFDRRIHFMLPDLYERTEILKIHAKNKFLAEDVDIKRLATITVGLSGADLENLMNEAAILSVRAGRDKIRTQDLFEAMYKVSLGPQRKTRPMTKEDLERTAYHEAGHAIVAAYIKDAEKVQTITIVPRGHSLGATVTQDEFEKVGASYKELLARIAVSTGGRVAESIVFGKEDIGAGASSDIERVTAVARAMIKQFGMSAKLGFVNYTNKDEYLAFALKQEYSDNTADAIDKETMRIVSEQAKLAEQILTRERKLLDAVAHELLTRETLDSTDFEKLFSKYAKVQPPKKIVPKVQSVDDWINRGETKTTTVNKTQKIGDTRPLADNTK